MGFYYILIFMVGLSLGSFFNVLVFRFNIGQSAVNGRSKCLNCQSIIKWRDLIPVLSYFVLGGKCRNCKRIISPFYPITELSTAAILLLFFLNTPQISWQSVLNVFMILLFTLITFLDLRYLIIPDKLLALLAISAISSKLLTSDASLLQLLISALGLTAFFAILFLVSRGKWIGLGDVKLIFMIGFLLGYPMGYLAIILAVWLAALVSIILLAAKKATAKTEIPLGSFLSLATIIFLIFSNGLQEISKYFY